MLNKDLYEKYLQKKAKKLGVSVDELHSSEPPKTETPSVTKTVPTQHINNVIETVVKQSALPSTTLATSKPVIIDRRENKFAVIGYPLSHSLSPIAHKVGFQSMNFDGTYEAIETTPEDLVERIKYLKSNNYKGFNVTIPLKLPITLFVDEVDRTADIAGAINTILINPDRTLKGYNTDVLGFQKAIPTNFKIEGKTAGILGTGGAAHAAVVGLAERGIRSVRFYTRNIPNSLDLLNYMRKTYPNIQFDAFQIEYIRDLSMVDILVNATPIGMLSHSADMTPVEKTELATLPKDALVYDIIYNPRKTLFLKLAESLGYKTVNGIDMFVGQAIASEEIWTGLTPNADTMKIAILENL